jgi:RNA polymerase sigma factor (sigma-70 family)
MRDEPLATVYRRLGPSVFRRARRILGLEADAHEVVQEVFLSLVEKPDQFRGNSSLTTFLYSATTHACLNRLRNSRNRERLEREHFIFPADEAAGPALSAEQLLMLQRALAAMPEDLAQAAIYYLVDGLTHDEIARILSCSRRHVGHLLDRLAHVGEGREAASC